MNQTIEWLEEIISYLETNPQGGAPSIRAERVKMVELAKKVQAAISPGPLVNEARSVQPVLEDWHKLIKSEAKHDR